VTAGRAETVVRLLDVLEGGSSAPALAETGDGRRWVLKFSGSGGGPEGLLAEFAAARLAASLGAPTPEVQPVWLEAGHPWEVGTDEFDDVVKRSAGWNLGVAYLEGATPASAAALGGLPVEAAARIWAADAALGNIDRTRSNPNLLTRGEEVWAVDWGACLKVLRAIAGRSGPPVRLVDHPFDALADQPGEIGEDLARDVLEAAPASWRPAGFDPSAAAAALARP
jgi:hypothetical protein